MSSVLEVRGLDVEYPGGARAVRDVSFSLEAGERVAVVGESGSGKSSLLTGILGLLPRQAVTEGSVRVQGAEVLGASERVLRRLRGRSPATCRRTPTGRSIRCARCSTT